MFTGLIECKGRITRLERRGRAGRLAIWAPFAEELKRGESVAVGGVCLTVASVRGSVFEVDVAERTMETTTLGRAATGRLVNLERALKVGERLGGHVVTGHVDGTATVVAVERVSNGSDVTIELPRALARHVVARGSIAVDGVSLTVARVEGARFRVSLVPETLSATTASTYRVGSAVNVETDVLAKYQESIAAASGEPYGEAQASSEEAGLTLKRLRELGFTE